MEHDDKSKKSSSKPYRPAAGTPLSLAQLMKQSPTNVSYKGYAVKVLFMPNLRGRSGWIAMARRDNVIIAGVDARGRICMFAKDIEAVAHICGLVDLDQENDTLDLSMATILEAFNE